MEAVYYTGTSVERSTSTRCEPTSSPLKKREREREEEEEEEEEEEKKRKAEPKHTLSQ